MKLSEVQKHLLGYFKSVHVSSHKKTAEFYELMAGKESYSENLKEEIICINSVIKQYDLEIVECVDELSTEKLYILVNTVHDEITQKAKFYDKNSTQFFSEIIKDCILSDNGHLTETRCLNLNAAVGLTKTAAQNTIDVFLRDKWLVSKGGIISLGMRTIMELKQSIKQFYPDSVLNCPLCKLIIVQGYSCKNCNARYHFVCLKKYNISSINKGVCIVCKKEWQNLLHEIKIEEGSDEVNPTSSSGSSTSVPAKRKRLSK